MARENPINPIWPDRTTEPDVLSIGAVREGMVSSLGVAHPVMKQLVAAQVIIGLGMRGEREALYDPCGLDRQPKQGHWTAIVRPLLIQLDFTNSEQVKLIRDAIATAKSDGESTQSKR